MSAIKMPRMPRTRPLSADFSFSDSNSSSPNKSSMIFSILPAAVQSRLPRLPSLRRSVSLYGLSNKREARSSPSSGRTTPLHSDSALVLSGERDLDGYYSEVEELRDRERPLKDTRVLELEERGSGIGWKFAGQGISLLSLSIDESTTLSSNRRCGSAPFARQLYIDAITYLLRGLPDDLSADEKASVRSALPGGIVEPNQVQANDPSYRRNVSPSEFPTSRPEPSLLHRILSSTIVQLFLLAQLLLPYLQILLQASYKYDREHRVSEKLLTRSVEAVDALGRRGINLGNLMWRLGLGEAAAWVIEGVAGGISDGIGEGLLVVGAKGRRWDSVAVEVER